MTSFAGRMDAGQLGSQGQVEGEESNCESRTHKMRWGTAGEEEGHSEEGAPGECQDCHVRIYDYFAFGTVCMASDCVRCKFIGFRASGYALLVKRYMVQDNLFYYSAKN